MAKITTQEELISSLRALGYTVKVEPGIHGRWAKIYHPGSSEYSGQLSLDCYWRPGFLNSVLSGYEKLARRRR